MSLDLSTLKPVSAPKSRKPLGFRLGIVAVIVASVLGVAKAWDSGYRPESLWQARLESLETIPVDQGEMSVWVRETGTLESASNTTVRCQVEALIGMVGGNTTKGQGGAAGAGGAQGGAAQGGGGGAAPAASAGSSSSSGGGAASKSGGGAAGKSGGGSGKSSSSS
jgi:hypothetical protein